MTALPIGPNVWVVLRANLDDTEIESVHATPEGAAAAAKRVRRRGLPASIECWVVDA